MVALLKHRRQCWFSRLFSGDGVIWGNLAIHAGCRNPSHHCIHALSPVVSVSSIVEGALHSVFCKLLVGKPLTELVLPTSRFGVVSQVGHSQALILLVDDDAVSVRISSSWHG